MEERARHFETTVDRASWRLVGLVHCADTTEQAYRDVEFGIEQWFKYFQTVAAFPQMSVTGTTVAEMIAFINSSGLGAVGTPGYVHRTNRSPDEAVERQIWHLFCWRTMGEPRGDAAQLRAASRGT